MSEFVEKTFCGKPFRVTAETSARMDDAEPMLERLSGVRPGDVFIDVGAGVGLYALRAAAMGAQVFAFEPHPPTRSVLGRNFMLNEMQEGLTSGTFPLESVVLPYVLWDGTEYPRELRREVFGRHYPTEECLAFRTVDEFFGKSHIDWMKLDVEGAELGVLRGAANRIACCRPKLLIEDHDGVNPDPACVVSRYAERIESSRKIRELLAGYGYRVEILPWGCGRRFLVAERLGGTRVPSGRGAP